MLNFDAFHIKQEWLRATVYKIEDRQIIEQG